MALINCPECGKEASDKAEKCPNCGYPFANLSNEAEMPGETPKENTEETTREKTEENAAAETKGSQDMNQSLTAANPEFANASTASMSERLLSPTSHRTGSTP